MLLSAATSFQVQSVLSQGNGFSIIQLREIQPPFALSEPVLDSGMGAEVQLPTRATTHATASSTVLQNP
ncbi:unnamed protein product, partial [Rotaria sp. Silwood2]